MGLVMIFYLGHCLGSLMHKTKRLNRRGDVPSAAKTCKGVHTEQCTHTCTTLSRPGSVSVCKEVFSNYILELSCSQKIEIGDIFETQWPLTKQKTR